MNSKKVIDSIVLLAFYIGLQLLFARKLVLFNYAFCYIYLASIILFPPDVKGISFLFLAFFVGLFIDIFSNTLGMHAAATVLVAFLRKPIILLLNSQYSFEEERMSFGIKSMLERTFFAYIFILVFIHHSLLFFVEASSLVLVWKTVLKIIASTIFTSFFIILLQYYKRE